mgnify:CR=1 FL=1
MDQSRARLRRAGRLTVEGGCCAGAKCHDRRHQGCRETPGICMQHVVDITLKHGQSVRHPSEVTANNANARDAVDEKCLHLMLPVLGARKSRMSCHAEW